MGYITKLVYKLLNKQTIAPISDAVSYNSYQNINKLHQNFAYFKSTLDNSLSHVKSVYKLLKDKNIDAKNKTIIDIGCGPGVLLNFLSKEFPESKLIGLDFSESKMEHARQIYPSVKFEAHSIYDAYPGTYDLIICTEVLEHLAYPQKALKNLLQLMHKNSKILITVPNGRVDNFSGHIFFWSPESWELFINENAGENCNIETGLYNKNKNNYAILALK